MNKLMENKQKFYYSRDEVSTCLDNLVLTLQTWAYDAEKLSHAIEYLDVVREINKIFGTNYSQSIDNVKKHFENKTPAKD